MLERRRSTGRLTVDQFEALEGGGPYRYELVRGRVVREPLPGELHGTLVVRLGHHLHEFVEARALGRVVSHVGVLTERGPDSVRGPDLTFIARNRMTRYPAAMTLRTAPDLCIEILSPSNRAAAMRRKVVEYFDAGVRLVWVVDPGNRRAMVHRSKTDVKILGQTDTLDGLDVLPGFELKLSSLFGPALGS